MMQTAPSKAATKKRIGYQKPKLNEPVYQEKLKRKQVEKKLEDDDPDYEPDVDNCKPPRESAIVQQNDYLPAKGNDGELVSTVDVPDGL
jgi:hypothetical protein